MNEDGTHISEIEKSEKNNKNENTNQEKAEKQAENSSLHELIERFNAEARKSVEKLKLGFRDTIINLFGNKDIVLDPQLLSDMARINREAEKAEQKLLEEIAKDADILGDTPVVESEVVKDEPLSEQEPITKNIGELNETQTTIENDQKLSQEEGEKLRDSLFDQNSLTELFALLEENPNIKLDYSHAEKLIDNGQVRELMKNLDKFAISDYQALANQLFEKGMVFLVGNNVDKFPGIDQEELVDKILKEDWLHIVISNIGKFNEINPQSLFNRLVESYPDQAFDNADKFSGINLFEAVDRTFFTRKMDLLINNIDKFTKDNLKELANKIIDIGFIDVFFNNIDKFTSVIDQETIYKIFKNRKGDKFFHNLDKFPGINLDQELANNIISTGEIGLFIENIDKFTGLDLYEVAGKIVDTKTFYIGLLFDNPGKFTDVIFDQKMAYKMIEADYVSLFFSKIDRFTNIVFNQEMANAFIKADNASVVVKNIDKFTGVDVSLPEIQNEALKEWDQSVVSENFDLAKKINDKFELRLERVIGIFSSIANSPSNEIRRMRHDLIQELRKTDNPEKLFNSIEQVFLHNNLPDVGKKFLVFEILYPPERIDSMLEQYFHVSPDLKKSSKSLRRYNFYRDAIKVSFDSNDRSLRLYIESFSGEKGDVIRKAEQFGVEELTAEELSVLKNTCKKLEVLYERSQLGQNAHNREELDVDSVDVNEVISSLRKDLRVPDGKNLVDRVTEMYLSPIGIKSINEALERMQSTSKQADIRAREFATDIKQNSFVFKEGDLLKGVESSVLSKVLENGMLAREFMGATADSDATPFDTDFDSILQTKKEGTKANILGSIANDYGDITILVRDRGQFIRTDLGEKSPEINRQTRDDKRYELFATKVLGEGHMGVRTGLGSMEIDGLFITDFAKEKLPAIAMDIVVGGRYIPVLDRDGGLLFTPEKFDEMREKFSSGLVEEGGVAFEVVDDPVGISSEHRHAVLEREKVVESNLEANLRVSERIQQDINEVLVEVGIGLVDPLHESLMGANVSESGSGSRGTNVPGAFDVDFLVIMNSRDLKSKDKIHNLLVERFIKLGGRPHEGNRPGQLRMLDVKFPGFDEGVDIDIGLVPKHGFNVYESHNAVADRLSSIKETFGTEKYKQVIANIVEAKSVLKAAKAYKKGDHGEGGLGGIGVENFILASGGNMIKAFEDFAKSAFDSSDQLKPFSAFKKDYIIMDPGINAKTNRHDNFVDNMNADGYSKMAFAVRDYLQKNTTQDRLS